MTKTKVFLVVAAAAFVSCSSDGNTTVPAQGSSADLGECNSYNESVTKQVSADGLYYKCTAGSWLETEREANNPGPFNRQYPVRFPRRPYLQDSDHRRPDLDGREPEL